MIKLQLLLSQPGDAAQLDPTVRGQLEALGMHVTGSGYASVSADIAPDLYEQLFGPPPPLLAGCVTSPQAAPALPVPAPLAGCIRFVTIAARPADMLNRPEH